MDKRVVVAMSGGVDSSVAALLLRKQGYDLVGISMQVWDYRNHGGSCSRATCCAPHDFTDARMVAGKIGIPYYVYDFEETFREEVIDKFVKSYLSGFTPNPCVDCNNKVKFAKLRERAKMISADVVATGHYARIVERDGSFRLLRGSDRLKDQSYFLYGIKREQLSETFFPVGEMTKDQVREIARAAGLSTAAKAESQDICFVSGSVHDFVQKIGGKAKKGDIVDKEGKKLGEHQGITAFTIGQRRGIGVGGKDDPLYVIELDPVANKVVVGPRKDLERWSFVVSDVNWVSQEIFNKIKDGGGAYNFKALAQVRHHHLGVEVNVQVDEDLVKGEFVAEGCTFAAGQAIVFYDMKNEEVLGGGTLQ